MDMRMEISIGTCPGMNRPFRGVAFRQQKRK